MRIAMVSETWAPDINGVAHTLGQLSHELHRRGVSIQLVRPAPLEPGRAENVASELQVRGFRAPGYPDVQLGLPARRRLLALWRKQRPDAIYVATEGPLGWSALNAARRLDIPVVSGFHTNFDHYAGDYGLRWLAWPVRAVLRHFHNRTRATLVPTRQRADELARCGFRGVRVMARGIDTRHFGPHRRDPALRRTWGVDPHQPVLLHVGRLAQEKNLDLLIESYRAMRAMSPALQLVIVGDGPLRDELERRLPEAIYTGFVDSDSLARHYASADLFVFPSRSETYGNVLLEAMASELGIVAFDYAAAAAMIETGRHGFTVALDDDQAFIDAALALCRNPGLAARLGRAARLRVEPQGWSSIADDFLATLRHVQETPHDTPQPSGV